MVTHHHNFGMTEEKCPKERVIRVEYTSATGIEQTEDSEIPVTLNACIQRFHLYAHIKWFRDEIRTVFPRIDAALE